MNLRDSAFVQRFFGFIDDYLRSNTQTNRLIMSVHVYIAIILLHQLHPAYMIISLALHLRPPASLSYCLGKHKHAACRTPFVIECGGLGGAGARHHQDTYACRWAREKYNHACVDWIILLNNISLLRFPNGATFDFFGSRRRNISRNNFLLCLVRFDFTGMMMMMITTTTMALATTMSIAKAICKTENHYTAYTIIYGYMCRADHRQSWHKHTEWDIAADGRAGTSKMRTQCLIFSFQQATLKA